MPNSSPIRRSRNQAFCASLNRLRGLAMLVVSCAMLLGNSIVQADEPVLRVNSTGSTSFVSSLVFSPDGQTIYSGGFDKVVRVWKWDQSTAQFQLDPRATYRLPIGPGNAGLINCMAISADGRYLAVGGDSVMRTGSVFNKPGAVFPQRGGLTPEMRLDQGRIFVFDTLTREVRTIRQHTGAVVSAQFLPGSNRYLVSVGDEWDPSREARIGFARITDIETDETVAGVELPMIQSRPGLATVSGGDDPLRAQIAVASGDSLLRVWDVATNRVEEVRDGTLENNAIVFADEQQRLLSGTFRVEQGSPPQGELNLWALRRGDGAPVSVGAPVVLPQNGEAFPFPRAMSILPRRAGSQIVLATRMTVPQQGDELSRIAGWEIGLFDLSGERLTMKRRISLTRIPAAERMPVLAASPDGEWFALAGSGDQTIRVYRTSDVDDGSPNPYQRLSGNGRVMTDAFFLRDGDQTGLALRGLQDDDNWVMNLTSRTLTEGMDARWLRNEPDVGGWTVTPEVRSVDDQTITTVTVAGPGLPARGVVIRLPKDHDFSDAALLPMSRERALPVEIPIMAIASHRNGLPRLALYNVVTGETIRELSGHVERILSLAFSRDGRFLVSTGNDQTVCAWSLVDIDLGVGKRGGLNGLALDNRGGRIVVVEVDETAGVAGTLRPGDVIESMVRGTEVIAFEKASEFYGAMWATTPGTRVTLNRTGDAPVVVTVEQGIDERKPLFSLFVEKQVNADGVSHSSWVAWSPLGPFDSSGDEIERHLGWHFNGDGPDDPVRFALLDEYPELRREGLLDGMMTEGRLPVVTAPPLERPTMRLKVPGMQVAGPKLPMTISEIPDSIELSIIGLTPRDIQSVSLLIDGDPVSQFTESGNQRWTAPTELNDWKRGAHRFAARVMTREINPQVFDQSLELSYFLAPPKIELPNGRQDWSDEETYELTSRITRRADEDVLVTLSRIDDGQSVTIREWTVDQGQPIDTPVPFSEGVPLEPGMNHFEIAAVNENAGDSTSRELSSIRMVVLFEPARIEPPAEVGILLDVEGDGIAGLAEEFMPGEALTTGEANPALIVAAKADGELPVIQMTVTNSTGDSVVSDLRFDSFDDRWIALTQPDIAVPGEYRLQLHDVTNDVPLFDTSVLLTAALPEITLMGPTGGEVLMKGKDSETIAIEASLIRDQLDHPFEAEVLLNDSVVDAPIDMTADELRSSLSLVPGENRIVIRLSNEFGETSTRVTSVFYRRPPTIGDVEAIPGDGPIADIRLSVNSDLPLIQAALNAEIWPESKLEILGSAPDWTVIFHEVPLAEGDNQFVASVANAEAGALENQSVGIRFEPPAPLEPAEIIVQSPNQPVVVDASSFAINFEVQSTSRLLQIEVRHDGFTVFRVPDVTSIRANADGLFVYRGTATIDLQSGPNHFSIVTLNQGGGENEVAVEAITYQEPPVRLMIEGITTADAPNDLIRPRLLGDGSIAFDEPIPSDVATIHVVADWRGLPDSFRNEQTPTIQVLVNEFMQLSNGVVDDEVSRFQLPVLLSKEENDVRVILPHYKGEASSQAEFTLRCDNPTPNKRLHLLIVGIGSSEADSRELEDRVLDSLRGTRLQDPKNFRTDTFENGLIYGPLVGSDLNQSDILGALINIQDTISILSDQSNYHDVVMLYVEGGRVVPRDGEFVVTTRPADSRISMLIEEDPYRFEDYSLATNTLRAMVQSTEGAKILMLDMLRGATEDIGSVKFDEESRTALLRFMWIDGESQARPFPVFLDVIAQGRRALRFEDWLGEFEKVAASTQGLTFQQWIASDLVNLVLVSQQRDGTTDQP